MGGKLIMPSIPSAPTDYVVDQINARLDLLEGSRPSNFYHAKHKERVAPTDYVVDQINARLDLLEGSRPSNFYHAKHKERVAPLDCQKSWVDKYGVIWVDFANSDMTNTNADLK